MNDLHRLTEGVEDPMAPAKGCANGMARSAAIWACLVLLILGLIWIKS